MSPAVIAERLGVNHSTVTRWMADGKLPRTGEATPQEVAPIRARKRQTPAQWADAIRKDYDLDETDDQLVSIGQSALEMSRDKKVPPHVRMTAAGRFQAIVRQLALVTRRAQEQPATPEAPANEADTPKKNPPVARPAGDPRLRLMAVNG